MHISSILVFSLVLHAVSAADLPVHLRTDDGSVAGKCNIDVCFALDGSFRLKSWQFNFQKRFVRNTVLKIRKGNTVSASGVQYGLDNVAISSLTNDTRLFLNELSGTKFSPVNNSFIAGGIVFCQRQLRGSVVGTAKIVLLGTGVADFGGDPVVPATVFRRDGGELFAIEIGSKTDRKALEDIAGSADNVFSVDFGSDVSPVVRSLLIKLCVVKPLE